MSRLCEPAFEVFQRAKTTFGRFSRRLRPSAAIRNDYDSAEGGRQRYRGCSSGGGRQPSASLAGAGRPGTGEPRWSSLNPTRYRRRASGIKWWTRGEVVLACFTVAAAYVLGGCATKESAPPAPRPGSGVAEYRELTSEAAKAVRAALAALDKVSVASNPCPPKLVAAYAGEVQRLHIDSLRIRARGQAIQARGDAYFADWTDTMARIEDPQIRERAERFRPELQECFSRIKLVSQQAGAAFKPFMSGLRMLRVQLDKPPSPAADETMKDLFRTTREHGGEVLQALSGIDNELDTITRLLTPGKTIAKQ